VRLAPFFFFQAEDGIRDGHVTGVQTCALPICTGHVTELMSFQGTPRLSWFGPDGNTMLFGAEAAGHVTWAWLDLARGTSRELGRSEERRVGKEGRWWGWADQW